MKQTIPLGRGARHPDRRALVRPGHGHPESAGSRGPGPSGDDASSTRGPARWAVAIPGAAAFIAALLSHELAHSLVARRPGVSVTSITMWALGGGIRARRRATDRRLAPPMRENDLFCAPLATYPQQASPAPNGAPGLVEATRMFRRIPAGRLRSDHPGHRPDLPAHPDRGRGPSPWPKAAPGQGRHQQLRPGPLVLAGWAVLTTAASVLVFKRSAVN